MRGKDDANAWAAASTRDRLGGVRAHPVESGSLCIHVSDRLGRAGLGTLRIATA